jgi:hypothetical protein
MIGNHNKRAGRRRGRRPALLLALGLITSLGAGSAVAAVVVSRSVPVRPGRPLVVQIAPSTRTVPAGATATYMVKVARTNERSIGLSGRTALAVDDAGLPAGADVTITSARRVGARLARQARTKLTISTSTATAPGIYEVRLDAERPHRRGSAVIELTISRPAADPPAASPPGTEVPPADVPPAPVVVPPVVPPLVSPDAFTIAGSLPGLLTPGTGAPLDLTLTNLENTDLLITTLDVEVTTVSGPRGGSTRGCDPDDFSVQQFSGRAGFTLRASSSADLGELGFGPREWPQVSMLNLPVNQDGCKGASLSLSFSGTATEATA